jgi:hypothetical protein
VRDNFAEIKVQLNNAGADIDGKEPADATILKDADIGVSVQAYDATYLVDADIGVNVEAYDATILKDADIGVTVQSRSALTKAIGNINNPLVNLPFKNSMAGDYAGTLTYTRASTATYVDRYGVVQSAAIDAPRFESEGLLIEGASTNICLQSEDLATTWVKDATTVTSNSIAAPDGATTADTLTADGTTAFHVARQNITCTASTSYTYSIYAKAGTEDTFAIYEALTSAAGCTFDLTNVTATLNGDAGSIAGSIVAVADGWYKCTFESITDAGQTTLRYALYMGGVVSEASSKDMYFWGAQLEELPFASSYIPTTTVAVTRAADICKLSFPDNMQDIANPYTIIVDADRVGFSGAYSYIFDIGDLGGLESTLVWANSVEGSLLNYYDAVNYGTTLLLPLDKKRYSQQYNGADVLLYVDGILIRTDADTSGFTGVYGDIFIGSGTSSGTQLFGHISNFRIYDIALSAEEMRIA